MFYRFPARRPQTAATFTAGPLRATSHPVLSLVHQLIHSRFLLATKQKVQEARQRGQEPPSKKKPFRQTAGEAAAHCGAGCTLGDIAAEWIVYFAPWALFGKMLYGTWVIDYVWASVLGIVFQDFTIGPMRGLSVGKGILAAMRADTLSLTAWQMGTYGWIAIVAFVLFGYEMTCGFLTSYPINRLLLKIGWKEKT